MAVSRFFMLITSSVLLLYALPSQAGPAPGPCNPQAQETPAAVSQESVARGKKLFKSKCKLCHGASGKGDASIAKMWTKKGSVLNLTSRTTVQRTDEELFQLITKGKGSMPGFKKLKEEDRWHLVNFIRTLQK